MKTYQDNTEMHFLSSLDLTKRQYEALIYFNVDLKPFKQLQYKKNEKGLKEKIMKALEQKIISFKQALKNSQIILNYKQQFDSVLPIRSNINLQSNTKSQFISQNTNIKSPIQMKSPMKYSPKNNHNIHSQFKQPSTYNKFSNKDTNLVAQQKYTSSQNPLYSSNINSFDKNKANNFIERLPNNQYPNYNNNNPKFSDLNLQSKYNYPRQQKTGINQLTAQNIKYSNNNGINNNQRDYNMSSNFDYKSNFSNKHQSEYYYREGLLKQQRIQLQIKQQRRKLQQKKRQQRKRQLYQKQKPSNDPYWYHY